MSPSMPHESSSGTGTPPSPTSTTSANAPPPPTSAPPSTCSSSRFPPNRMTPPGIREPPVRDLDDCGWDDQGADPVVETLAGPAWHPAALPRAWSSSHAFTPHQTPTSQAMCMDAYRSPHPYASIHGEARGVVGHHERPDRSAAGYVSPANMRHGKGAPAGQMDARHPLHIAARRLMLFAT